MVNWSPIGQIERWMTKSTEDNSIAQIDHPQKGRQSRCKIASYSSWDTMGPNEISNAEDICQNGHKKRRADEGRRKMSRKMSGR
jgi:hypothetical protein